MLSPSHLTISGGLLVAFEGVDGAGKSTQARLAQHVLQDRGYEVLLLREPSDGPVGQRLRALLSGERQRPSPEEEFRLFLEDRRDDVERNIAPALSRGAVVLIDRYYISSMAYQGARGLDFEMIRTENEKIAPRPHLTLLFTLPLEESLSRLAGRSGGKQNRNPFEIRQYQERVHRVFREIDLPGLVRIDAGQTVDQTHTTVMDLINSAISSRPSG